MLFLLTSCTEYWLSRRLNEQLQMRLDLAGIAISLDLLAQQVSLKIVMYLRPCMEVTLLD
jgi:hypothetical protein